MRSIFCIGVAAIFCSLSVTALHAPKPARGTNRPAARKVEPHRSPSDLAVLPSQDRVLTANQTADTVSLVDLKAGKVLDEQPSGRKPAAVACSPDGKHAAVSNLWSGTISFFDIRGHSLKPAGTISIGPFPRGLVFAPDGKILYVAVAGASEVAVIDVPGRKTVHRWAAAREPRQLALSSDGSWLAAASSLSSQVRCWDTRTKKLIWERKIEDAFNLAGLAFTPDRHDVICTHAVRREFPVTRENIGKGWVIDSRLTRLTMQADALPFAWQIALDTHGKAVGDPQGGAFSPDGKWFALTGSGTHELLILGVAAIPWNAGDPGDFLDAELQKDVRKFRRVPLGGRPMQVAFRKHTGHAVIANYLGDSVQIVDVRAGKLLRTIPLGSPAQATAARQGEALFYDGRRSHNQWFSCHSCHVDGHTCGLTFDTLNDDSYGNPKLTPTLRNVANTGPWTWHGWQRDLGAAVNKSLTETMFGPKPTSAETAALVAFLQTLKHPPHPRAKDRQFPGPAALRGKALFNGKPGCVRCHQPPAYTSPKNYNLGMEDGSRYHLWNPPSLLGLYDRGPYMHDARARTLDELLQEHHVPEKLGGKKLTSKERQDLIAFLQSL
jgi:DNA-binding beta-propeller fold protein YncE